MFYWINLYKTSHGHYYTDGKIYRDEKLAVSVSYTPASDLQRDVDWMGTYRLSEGKYGDLEKLKENNHGSQAI